MIYNPAQYCPRPSQAKILFVISEERTRWQSQRPLVVDALSVLEPPAGIRIANEATAEAAALGLTLRVDEIRRPDPKVGAGRVLAVQTLAHHDRARVDAIRLHRRLGHAVVADQWVGEDDDLAAVARVADRLLVARHRRVEHDLAGGRNRRADGVPIEPSAVLEQQVGRSNRPATCDLRPATCAHTAPIANDRSRYATAPPATVIRTRPVSVLPAKQQLVERLS